MSGAPTVSVVIPCRNEADHIERCLRSLLSQNSPPGGFEVIVADGMSTDGTRRILRELADENASVRLVDNTGLIVSTGLNRAIAAAKGEIVIRADAHTEYAPDYIARCVATLRDTGADNVGGPWVAAPRGYVASAIAAAFHSKFGSGGGRAHDPQYEGPVDTVYLGCWRRATLEQIGGFDEELVRNQDDELNLRLTRRGRTVWQSPTIKSWYHPRGSFRQLARQYAQYGYWKVRVIQKHRLPASWRHVVPAIFVSTMLAFTSASPFSRVAATAAALVGGLYVGCTVAASAMVAARSGIRLLPVLPLAFFCMQIGYGAGFMLGLIDFCLLRAGPAARMSAITRRAEEGATRAGIE